MDPNETPKLQNPAEGGSRHINVPTPKFDAVRHHAQVPENALCFFGLFAIKTDEWRLDWVPEQDKDERNTLSMTTFACERDLSCPDGAPLVPVDFVSRCVSMSDNCTESIASSASTATGGRISTRSGSSMRSTTFLRD